MLNHYIALLNNAGDPVVTLPPTTYVSDEGKIKTGEAGSCHIWNGDPPDWCAKIVEVKTPGPFKEADSDDIKVLWEVACTWCGKGKVELKKVDAAGIVHYFHEKCYRESLKFVKDAAHNTRRT